MSAPYQAGLARAVGELIGHPPGACEACHIDPGGPMARLVRDVLAARERGSIGLAASAVRLTARWGPHRLLAVTDA